MRHASTLFTLLYMLWSPCATADPNLGNDLPGLLAYAREHNPALAAARHEATAAMARSDAADALADPLLRIEPMDINGNRTTRLTLMQRLPWYGTRDLRQDNAVAQAEQAAGQQAASDADLARRMRQGYAQYYYAAHNEALTRQMLTLLDGLEQIAQTRYANGQGAQQDVIRVQLAQTRLQDELLAAENTHHHSQVRLNALLSRPGMAELAEPQQLPPVPAPAQLDERTLLAQVDAANPQLRIAEAGVRAADSQRELTYAERYPDVTLGVAPTLAGGSVQSWNLMLELAVPLQQSARRSQEGAADAALAAADARRQAWRDQQHAALSEALASLETARRSETLIATRLLPQARLAADAALAGYETGQVAFSMLIDAQQQLLAIRRQQLQAQTEMQLRLADIENLIGETL
ncbi:MAG: TolC family protein [Pseudomonadota bacterium]